MRVGIDASNLRAGGGVTHLAELLRYAEPERHGITSVTVWGGRRTLERLPSDKTWLRLVHEPRLDGILPVRAAWQRLQLPRRARETSDVLFVPGGTYGGSFRPYVTMFRNMLPFDATEMLRYAFSWTFIRLVMLRVIQRRTFRRADAIIFLNEQARDTILRQTRTRARSCIIPHGVSDCFRREPQPQRGIETYSRERPFRFLYTSIIDLYKHQWNVAEAVLRLRAEGLPIALNLVGPAYPPAMAKLEQVLKRFPAEREAVCLRGEIRHADLAEVYHGSDAFVFASTCENMPNILIEAMAAGLPIASSRVQPMIDVLGEAGVWFDAENADSIVAALRRLIADPALRQQKAASAYARAQAYSWRRCADETFTFLACVAAAGGGR